MKKYLKSTYYFDFENPKIQKLVFEFKNLPTQEKIKGLYLKIRDGWRYNPFKIRLTKEHYISSKIADYSEAHCIDKAILYISCLRALNIPARLHLAKVSNHIAAERLEEKIGTNELTPHGLVAVYFNEKWVKCSPAFNKELCKMYNVDVLNFDGTKDMILQQYNKNDEKFMTYLQDYGHFEDVPFDFMMQNFKEHYPLIFANNHNLTTFELKK